MSKNHNLDLVILAGGRGSRISKITKKIPKPLIKINKIEFLQHLLNYYSKFCFRKIFILTGYKGYMFNKYHNKNSNLIPIECVRETTKLDTAGCLYQIKNKVSKNFILINGDSFINFDFKNFSKNKIKNNKVGKILLVKNKNYLSNKKLSNLKILSNNKIILGGKLMNGGVYQFNNQIFNYISNKRKSLEKDVLPKLIENGLLNGHYSKSDLLDIGTYSNLKKAEKFIKKNTNKFSVFLDRDGVINEDKNYVYKIKDFTFRKNVIKSLQYLTKKKINIFIVTNQAGIAKGYYSEKDFFLLSNYLKKKFVKKNINLNDIEYCPFHPHGIIKKYKKKSNYRKPGNLMIKKLINKWNINTSNSIMIGDKISDKKAAKKSNIYFEYAQKDLYDQLKKLSRRFI